MNNKEIIKIVMKGIDYYNPSDLDKNVISLGNYGIQQFCDGVEVGRKDKKQEKDNCLIQMKKQKDYWRDKYRKRNNEILKMFDLMDIELFLEDVIDVKTKKKVKIPKEILELWEIYWEHIKEKLKSKILKINKRRFR